MKAKDDTISIILNDLADSKRLACQIASLTDNLDVITLKGDLGVGKTAFTKYFINNFFQEEQRVISPTFNLLQLYHTERFTIWHFDLYRLKTTDEIWEIGIEEAFAKGVSVIEWPEVIMDIIPEDRLELNMEFLDEQKRLVKITGYGNWKIKLMDF